MVVKLSILDEVEFRPAKKIESRKIAELISIASDGVLDYVWSKETREGEEILEVGRRMYENEDMDLSYKNCVFAEIKGEIAGVLATSPVVLNSEMNLSEIDPVFVPYMTLQEEQSYYIWAVSLYDKFRGQGIGTAFMEIAELKAKEHGLTKLSLLVFEQNTGAVRLYKRLGYAEAGRQPVVPHQMIKYTGDVVLMVKHI